MKQYKNIIGALGVIAVLILAGAMYLNHVNKAIGGEIYPKPFANLIGTRTASTTVGVGWYGKYAASTTYPFSVSGVNSASLVFDAVSASTSAQGGSGVHIAILGSNDPECATASTTSSLNAMLVTEIKWFDAGPYLANAAVTSALSSATTTIAWENPFTGAQRVLNFQNLNINCLGVQVNASSTSLQASYRLKD